MLLNLLDTCLFFAYFTYVALDSTTHFFLFKSSLPFLSVPNTVEDGYSFSSTHVCFAKMISATAKTSITNYSQMTFKFHHTFPFILGCLCSKDGLFHFQLAIPRACCIQLSKCFWNQTCDCPTTILALWGSDLCQWIIRVRHVPSFSMMLPPPYEYVWHQHAYV